MLRVATVAQDGIKAMFDGLTSLTSLSNKQQQMRRELGCQDSTYCWQFMQEVEFKQIEWCLGPAKVQAIRLAGRAPENANEAEGNASLKTRSCKYASVPT